MKLQFEKGVAMTNLERLLLGWKHSTAKVAQSYNFYVIRSALPKEAAAPSKCMSLA